MEGGRSTHFLLVLSALGICPCTFSVLASNIDSDSERECRGRDSLFRQITKYVGMCIIECTEEDGHTNLAMLGSTLGEAGGGDHIFECIFRYTFEHIHLNTHYDY